MSKKRKRVVRGLLTLKKVAKLSKPGRHLDGHNLYLQVSPSATKSWLLRYERDGRERWMGLGPLHTFNLAEARERARKARQLLADGIDPLDSRKAERDRQAKEAAKSKKFATVAQEYYDAHESSWSNRSWRRQFTATMRDYVYPVIGSLPVAEVDEPLILKILTPIWKEKTVTAKRVRNRIAAVLDFAAAAKYRTGTNPARWEGHLEHLLAAPEKLAPVKHHAALPYVEVAAFLSELRAQPGIAARALEFLIMTATRTGEVANATWSEINLRDKVWVIPAERMKAAKEHRVPLSEPALALLRELPREGEYVFIGNRTGAPISWIAMWRTLRRLRQSITVHGFRSTFRDWAAERTNYPNHVVEQALAHSVGNAVERAYRRGDLFEKRRRLMSDWARYCSTPRAADTGNIVALQVR
jgi:integrase